MAVSVNAQTETPLVQGGPAYGRAVGDGTTKKFELVFDQKHPYTVGIQYTDPDKNPAKVSVLGAWLITTTTGISNIENVKLQDGKAFNLAGLQVAKGYKGIVIKE